MTDSELTSFVTESDLEMLNRPVGEARGLPGAAYGARFYQLEQQKLFPRQWCVAGFECDIPQPGDVRPVELAGWPLLLVRGEDAVVRVFHNICRHRSNTLVDEPGAGLTRVVCPWHSWSYDLQGRLCATPRIGGERAGEDATFECVDVDLKEVTCVTWLGFVLVNIHGNASDFRTHIAPLENLLGDYDLTGLEAGDRWSIDFEGNWKLTVENAIEDYHLPYVHRELVRGVGESNYRLDFAEGCFYANSTLRDSAGGYADTRDEGAVLPAIVKEGRDNVARTYAVNLFPNGFITFTPDCLWLWMLAPDGHDSTRVDTRQYYKKGTVKATAYNPVRKKLVELWQLTLRQDAELVSRVHDNLEHPGDTGIRTRFSPYWEANIQRFQQAVVFALTG